jgi:hypothetical protein
MPISGTRTRPNIGSEISGRNKPDFHVGKEMQGRVTKALHFRAILSILRPS